VINSTQPASYWRGKVSSQNHFPYTAGFQPKTKKAHSHTLLSLKRDAITPSLAGLQPDTKRRLTQPARRNLKITDLTAKYFLNKKAQSHTFRRSKGVRLRLHLRGFSQPEKTFDDLQ